MDKVVQYIEKFKALELDKVIDFNKFNLIAITSHSTQIEGATLSIEEASLLLNDGITPKGKPLEHSLMVKDHHNALLEVLKKVQNFSSLFNEKLICDINRAVMKHTGQKYNTPLGQVDAAKGELRKGAVFVQKRYFPDYKKVPGLLNQLCKELNERITQKLSVRQQINLGYSAHFNLVSIHPFYDGNGRTARLMMNLIQKYFDMPLSIVYAEDKLEYFAAIEKSRETGSIEPFNVFMDAQYIKFLASEIELFEQQVKRNGKGNNTMSLLF